MENAVRVTLVGAAGRLGEAIVRTCETQEGMTIARRCGRGDRVADSVAKGNVVIDVSSADAVEEICDACVEHRRPLIIGTTGHSDEQMRVIEAASAKIPIVVAPNFSVGVNALFWLARKAAELLGDDFDIEVIEAHHRLKKDAPSGTAKRLAELLRAARSFSEGAIVHGSEGITGERPAQQIGMHAIRAGDIVGEHTVMFAGSGERLELTHRASSRDTFAVGALRAARWVATQKSGLYSMEHVLGLDRAG
ncbi:MAG: 4-hydroxy-tetrahydrodipicolinate reductase [Verrucomicrobiota bacterium]|nr:4-hydroxy-tetrahydrodipicolinate reductase [Verrucomicrobiota bacterium]